jgi:hypothetical protein
MVVDLTAGMIHGRNVTIRVNFKSTCGQSKIYDTSIPVSKDNVM